MSVAPIPTEHPALCPYLVVHDGAAAIEFYTRAFGAEETYRLASPDGTLGHAGLRVGDCLLMLADEHPDMGYRSPRSLGGAGLSLLLYVEDVDSAFPRAIEAGAKELRPVEDQFYGDRAGTLEDPFGHVWTLASRKELLSDEEITARFRSMMSPQKDC